MSDSWRPTAAHWGLYQARYRGDGVVETRPDSRDPNPSPIGSYHAELSAREHRIFQPMARAGYLENEARSDRRNRGRDPLIPVDWSIAIDLAARAIERVRQEYGNRAIYGGSYGWASAGRFHHAQSQLKRFLTLAGGFTDTVNTYSHAAAEVIVPHILGDGRMMNCSPSWEVIAERTELLVAFGGLPIKNTQIDSGLAGYHSDSDGLIGAMRSGTRVVVINPVIQEQELELGCQWIAPRPNTDVAMMFGLAHTLIIENRHDLRFLNQCCEGADRFVAYLLGKTDGVPKSAAWAAQRCGVTSEIIRSLARDMSKYRTLITATWSLQRGDHGEQPMWATVALAALLGHIGIPGEGFSLGHGCFGGWSEGKSPFKWAALPRDPNPVETRLPVSRITDVLLSPGSTLPYNGATLPVPEIQLIYWVGGNPFHHHQDLNRLIRALHGPETIIVNDPFLTPFARFADIVLPANTPLERNDFATSLHGGYATPMRRVLDSFGDSCSDHEIFTRLADRLGFGSAFTEQRTEMEWIEALYTKSRENARECGIALPVFEVFWNGGPLRLGPFATGLDDLVRLRSGPENHPLATPSGKIELFSTRIDGFGYTDCAGHPTWYAPREWLSCEKARDFPLHLLSDQPRSRLHSQLDFGERSQADKIHGREPVLIHPTDAERRSIRPGGLVRVFNERGATIAGAVITERIRPGVIQISTGAWYACSSPGDPSALEIAGNPNVLTGDFGCSSLSQGPSVNTALVDVERLSR